MRRLLLAGAAMTAIGVGSVRGDMPVIDMTSIQHLLTEISWLRQQYTELQSVYSSLAHPTGILASRRGQR